MLRPPGPATWMTGTPRLLLIRSLALTMVIVGALAAWSVNHAQKRFSGFGEWMRRAPYISCALLVILAAFMAWQGWQGLSQPHAH